MPTYRITAPDGRRFKVTGDSPPSEAELEDIFARMAPAPRNATPARSAPVRPMASHGGSLAPAAAPPSSPLGRLGGFVPGGRAAVDVGRGALSGLLSTAYHGGDLIRRGLGMERVIDDPAAQEAMTPPDSLAGKAGFYGEQIGEFLAPAAAVSKGVKGAGLLTKMAAEGAMGAGVAAVQTGGDSSSMALGAGFGAALPPAGKVVKAGYQAAQRAAYGAKEGGLGGAVASAMRTAAPADPKTLITQALKPRSTNTRFVESLDRSLPELKVAEETLGRPISGLDDLLEATKVAKKNVRAIYDQMAGPQREMGSTVDLSPVAEAVTKSIPKRTALQAPQVAESVAAKAATYRQRFSLEDAEQLLRETNAELDGFYAKYPTAQRRALASDPAVAALEAEAKTLRNVIYMALDNPGQGKAAREVNQRYGALLRLEEETYRRANVAKRQQPESLSEQIGAVRAAGDAARGAWRLMHGDVSGAADLASAGAMRSTGKFLKEQQTADALIARALKSFSGRPVPVDLPPPVTIRGLLNRGPIPMGAKPDESGVWASEARVMGRDAQGRPIYSSDPRHVIDAEFAAPEPAAPVATPAAPQGRIAAGPSRELLQDGPPPSRGLPPSNVRGLLAEAPPPPAREPIALPGVPEAAAPTEAPAAAKPWRGWVAKDDAPAKAAAPDAGDLPPGVSLEDLPTELATRAHSGTSWTPDVRAAGEQREYVAHMRRVWDDLSGRAKTPEQQAAAAREFERYREGYATRYRQVLQSKSGVVSSMIAGPSKFPARQMSKRGEVWQKRLTEFLEWDKRAQKAMRQEVDPAEVRAVSADRSDAVEALQQKIDDARKMQDAMKLVNGIVRTKASDAEKIAQIMERTGLSEKTARKALEPDFVGRRGFPDYEIKNNLANIKRMEARITEIGQNKARPVGAAEFDGGRIEENADANRIQVIFDAKPDEATRERLKANGFRWAPSQGAWQRQRNDNGRAAVERLFGVKLAADAPPAQAAPAAPKTSPRGVLPTPEVARAAGADAGNRSARDAGRTAWSADDYNAAANTYNKVDPPPVSTKVEPMPLPGDDERFIVSRPSNRVRGASDYVSDVDRVGAGWTDRPDGRKLLTRAEVHHIVESSGNPYALDIRSADYSRRFNVADVQGYAGQNENDEAIYDAAKAWNATQAAAPKTTPREFAAFYEAASPAERKMLEDGAEIAEVLQARGGWTKTDAGKAVQAEAAPSGERGRLLELARKSDERWRKSWDAMSGTDMAEGEIYNLEADFYRAMSSGADQETTIKALDDKWRAYAAKNNAGVEGAPKISRGPYAGASSRHHRYVSPDLLQDKARHWRQMAKPAADAPAPSKAETMRAASAAKLAKPGDRLRAMSNEELRSHLAGAKFNELKASTNRYSTMYQTAEKRLNAARDEVQRRTRAGKWDDAATPAASPAPAPAPAAPAAKPYTRDEWLQQVGDPAETNRKADALMDEAQAKWDTIKAKLYTADGKLRKQIPQEALNVQREIDDIRDEAGKLRKFADAQHRMHDELWSHARPRDTYPGVTDYYGMFGRDETRAAASLVEVEREVAAKEAAEAAARAARNATPAPATVQPAAKAPAQTPAAAAAEVREELARVVDVSGAKSAAEIQRRVTAALMEELQAAKKVTTHSVEVRKYGNGKPSDVLVNGERVASIDHKGRLMAYSGADETALEMLRDSAQKTSNGRDLGHVGRSWTDAKAKIDALMGRNAANVTIRIPGDGTFTVKRTPAALQEMIRRVTAEGSSPWQGLSGTKVARPSLPTYRAAGGPSLEDLIKSGDVVDTRSPRK
jgi:hypothetical protein